MKRDILCKACSAHAQQTFPEPEPYPGEFVKFVFGKAKTSFICDYCGKIIIEKERCCAFSLYTKRNPYFEWEDGYIA